ncbi:MAG: glycosyltransferase family 39 protein [Anaerolineae bacterium]|nr:glycosyltransferase family 39 protein [Anaerolineae bacterium]
MISQCEPTRKERVLALIVFAVVLVSSLLTLTRFPEPHIDEANRGSLASAFYHTGAFTTDLRGDLLGFDEATAGAGRLYAVGLGSFFEVFGTRLFVARLFSMTGWLLTVVMIYLIGWRLFDSSAGLFAALVFTLTARPFLASHCARPDIWTVATVLCVTYFYLHTRRFPTPARHFMLGLLLLWPVEQHFAAVWLLLPVAFLVFVDNYRDRRGRCLIGAFALGGLLAVAAFFVLQFFPDPARVAQQFRSGGADFGLGKSQSDGMLERLVWTVDMFLAKPAASYRSNILFSVMLPGMILYTLYALFGLASAVYRGSISDELLLALWGIGLLTFAFGMAHKNPFYALMWDPFFALFAGAAITGSGGLREKIPALRKASPVVLIAPLVIVSLLGRLALTGLVWPYDNAAYQDQLAENVPDGVDLMAPGPMWYTFRETTDFTSDWYFATWACHRESPLTQEDMADLLSDLEIDYVIDQGELDLLFDCPNRLPPDAPANYTSLLEDSCAVVERTEKPPMPGGRLTTDSTLTTVYDCRGAFSDRYP